MKTTFEDKLKHWAVFAKNIVTNTRQTGAFGQIGDSSGEVMLSQIDFTVAKVLVEFGAGVGNMTALIQAQLAKDAHLYVFEINDEFCAELKKRFADDARITIYNQPAATAKDTLAELGIDMADGVLSTLPFTVMDKQVVIDTLTTARTLLKENAHFITIGYSKWLVPHAKQVFDEVTTQFVPNDLPPTFIITCSK